MSKYNTPISLLQSILCVGLALPSFTSGTIYLIRSEWIDRFRAGV